VGDGSVDHQRLLTDAALLLRREGIKGEHVVEAVAKLDDEHPDILDRGDEHLAETERGGDKAFAGV